MRILGIAGSLRSGSFNAALLRAAAEVVPEGWSLEIASIREIPLYDGDREAEGGPPPAVLTLKQSIAGADGLLLASPEYNNSIPGVLKNAIDWASRKPSPFRGKAVALLGATPGPWGTTHAQVAWLQVFRALGVRPYFGGTLRVSDADDLFVDGTLTDDRVRGQLREFVAGFTAFVASSRG